jgi:methylmalonyl-CoA mutase N-terminal domain/subunit
MESAIEDLIAKIDDVGGMYRAVESGLVQGIIGESALAFEAKVESGEQKVVGVNSYVSDPDEAEPAPYRPDPQAIGNLVTAFKNYKDQRSTRDTRKALDALARVANSEKENIFAAVVESAELGATHGEIVACLRNELGFGHPLIVT